MLLLLFLLLFCCCFCCCCQSKDVRMRKYKWDLTEKISGKSHWENFFVTEKRWENKENLVKNISITLLPFSFLFVWIFPICTSAFIFQHLFISNDFGCSFVWLILFPNSHSLARPNGIVIICGSEASKKKEI